jgi:sigma-B regulation protein RsbU (phosphoserine phosphatase)
MNNRQTSLNRKIASSLFAFAFLLVLIIASLICVRHYRVRIETYTEKAYDYTHTLAAMVDGDKVAGYVDTFERDEHFNAINNYINAAQKETDVKYFYVIIPREDDIVYVWDAGPGGDAYPLGYHEKYESKDDEEAMKGALSKDPVEKIVTEDNDIYGYIASAYSPIYNSAGEPVALACVDMPLPGFLRGIIIYLLMLVLGMAAATAAATYVLYTNMNRQIIGPINTLKKSVDDMVGNLERDEAVEIDIHTGDEIEDLANAFTRMDGDLRDYIRDLSDITAEKERIGAELNVAANIQQGVLPIIFPAFPELKEFDLYASMDPAKEVGGDFYDFFMVDDEHIALVMADVAGKGIPASLFMMVSKIIIKTNILSGMSPSEALHRANEQLLENNKTGMFVTVWIAVIEITTGKGVVANAGHEHPALRRKDGEFELIRYKHSPAVGMIEGMQFAEHEFKLDPGDTVFVYTDGVPEAENSREELMGDQIMLDALNANPDAGPQELIRTVRKQIDRFAGDAPQFDDITMLAFKYYGRQ